MPEPDRLNLRTRLPPRSGLNLFDFQRAFLFGGESSGFMDPVDLCRSNPSEAILYCEEEEDEGHSFIFSRCEDSQLLFLPQAPLLDLPYSRTLVFLDSPSSIATFFSDFLSVDIDFYRFDHPKLIQWRKKRSKNRLLLDTELTISRRNGRQVLARLYDFSMSGIAFQTNVVDFSEGELILVEFMTEHCGAYESAATIVRQEINLHQNHKTFAAARLVPTKAQRANIERIFICSLKQDRTFAHLNHLHDAFISPEPITTKNHQSSGEPLVSATPSQPRHYYSPDNHPAATQARPQEQQSQVYSFPAADKSLVQETELEHPQQQAETLDQQQIISTDLPTMTTTAHQETEISTEPEQSPILQEPNQIHQQLETPTGADDYAENTEVPQFIADVFEVLPPPTFESSSHSREDSMSDEEQLQQQPVLVSPKPFSNNPATTFSSQDMPVLRKPAKQGSSKIIAPQLNNELAMVLSQKGALHLERYEFNQAIEQFRRVIQITSPQEEANHTDSFRTLSQQELQAIALRGEAEAMHALGQDEDAAALVQQALSLLQTYPGAEVEDMPNWTHNLALTLLTHAKILQDRDLANAEVDYRRALEHLDAVIVKLGVQCPPQIRLRMSLALAGFAELFLMQEQSSDALSLIDRAQAVLQDSAEALELRKLSDWRLQFARLQGQRCQALRIQGQLQAATQHNREAETELAALQEQFQQQDMPALVVQAAVNLNEQAQILACTSRHEQAVAQLSSAVSILGDLQERLHENFGPHLQIMLARTHLQRASSELSMGQAHRAETSCQQATPILEKLRKQEYTAHSTALVQTLAESLVLQGKIYTHLGNTQAAMETFDQAANLLSA